MTVTEENIDLLFSKNKEEEIKQIEQIETCMVHPFKDHPYKVRDNDEMQELINSIKEYGILEPIKLRKDDFSYEVISGHRRLRAAMKLGLQTLPAMIYDISRDEATIMLVDSNLHREHILPSEKAFSYKMKYEAMKRTAGRPSNNSCQVGTNLRTDEEIAETSDDSARQIQRYIRLTNLIPKLLDLLDEGKIAFSVAVELSYLDEDKQNTVLNLIEELDCTPSYAQANHMHKDFISGTLTKESLKEMLCSDKPNQKPVYKVKAEKLAKFINPDTPPKQAEEFIIKACDYYSKHLTRQKNRDVR
ncbi:MAG: ParB/RepB/Spo0J family partition protein [Ruminococcus sp.]|nr:ParB/RepB/Spo0J family partition protein [Candidatus Copronaster equi]